MNRRDSLKRLALAAGGLVVLPSWAREWSVNDIRLHASSFTATEQELLAAVADTIIPPGNSIGALSVGVDKFLQKLITDCYDKDVQENVKTQLNNLNAAAQNAFKKSFQGCDQTQRQELLLKFSASTNKPEKDFFDLMKSETIRGFNTSREVMIKYLNYKVAPGHYHGCVDVKA
ncbi:MAG TPA: gluconate 2-dehydrogenase subunit 3 family protein [Ohtaekwangia sp.]